MNIKCINLQRHYEKLHAVNGVSFDVSNGKILGIVGKSGAGKSTLIRLLSLLEKADSGEVYYDEKRVDNLSSKKIRSLRKNMGMIFQSFNLFSSRNVISNVLYPLEIAKYDKKKARARAEELLEIVGLSEKMYSGISTLSGGQKQRVAIARALALNAKVLFCDEATSALDPQSTKGILDLIKKIQESFSLTVIMVTHQMEVVRSICDDIIVMDNGVVVERGSVESVFKNPSTDIMKQFLRNLSFVNPDKIDAQYCIQFIGDNTHKPILSTISRKHNIDFNIKAGGKERSEYSELGCLYIDLIGSDDDCRNAITELSKYCNITELGQRDI